MRFRLPPEKTVRRVWAQTLLQAVRLARLLFVLIVALCLLACLIDSIRAFSCGDDGGYPGGHRQVATQIIVAVVLGLVALDLLHVSLTGPLERLESDLRDRYDCACREEPPPSQSPAQLLQPEFAVATVFHLVRVLGVAAAALLMHAFVCLAGEQPTVEPSAEAAARPILVIGTIAATTALVAVLLLAVLRIATHVASDAPPPLRRAHTLPDENAGDGEPGKDSDVPTASSPDGSFG